MIKIAIIVLVILVTFLLSRISSAVDGNDRIHYSFESGKEGWWIPDWAYYQSDHKAESVEVTSKRASDGKNSLEVMCDFPGDTWSAALIEVKKDADLSGYKTISADVYIPKKAPRGVFTGRIILTTGIGWYFTEMREPVILRNGRWTTIKARLDTKEVEHSQWRGRKERSLWKNIHNVRKIAVRVECNPSAGSGGYKGPIFIDNLVIK